MEWFVIVINAIAMYICMDFTRRAQRKKSHRFFANLLSELDLTDKQRTKLQQMISGYQQKQEEVDDNGVLVDIEKHGEQYYIFIADSNKFLQQGSSLTECFESIRYKYPQGVTLTVNNGKEFLAEWKENGGTISS